MADTPETPAQSEGLFKKLFKHTLPIEQRALLGTLVFFAVILVTGWVGLNESHRMKTFTAEYNGRSIERGAVIFSTTCSGCHGLDGKGQTGVAPALNAPDLFDGSRLQSLGWNGTLHDYVYLTVSAGRPKRTSDWAQPMPTWSQEYGGPLRPDQVRDVVAYVLNFGKFYEPGYTGPGATSNALPTPTPQPYDAVGTDLTVELPQGDPARGQALFEGTTNAPDGQALPCHACHSIDGTTGTGPSLQGIATTAGTIEPGKTAEQYLHESIVLPCAYVVEGFQCIMPQTFGDRLDKQSLADIIAYLMTLK